MKKRNTKGFTIVELVIVIAVIAILAAVLIPTFSGLIDKANVSNDEVLVRNLNTLLATDETLNGDGRDRITINTAIQVAADNGYDVEKLTPTSEGRLIVWDENENRFYLTEADDIRAGKDGDADSKPQNIWVITEKYDSSRETYSQYLKGKVTADITAKAGISVGNNQNVNVAYEASDEVTVSFLLNNGTLTVNNANATVHSYGYKSQVTVTAVASNSYHEWGSAGYIEAVAGRVVAEAGCSINLFFGEGDVKLVIRDGANVGQVAKMKDTELDADEAPGVEVTVVADEAEKNSLIAAATMFAGGDGTEGNPYRIANAEQFNNMYTQFSDSEYKYFELVSDIDFEGKVLDNLCVSSPNKIWAKIHFDGNGHTVSNISTISGRSQIFPFLWDATIENVTFDYDDIVHDSAVALCYTPYGDVTFKDVTVTGTIKTTANWASAFVSYTSQKCNLSFINCTNYANMETAHKAGDSFAAAFIVHDGGSKVTTNFYFENCKNYGTINSATACAIVGMKNGNCYNYANGDAVQNYGRLLYSHTYGYLGNGLTGATANDGGITLTIDRSGGQIFKYANISLPEPTLGEELVIAPVDGATEYVVAASVAVHMNNGSVWTGAYPRSLTKTYAANAEGNTVTDFLYAYVYESRVDKTGETAYTGLYAPEGFDLNNANVLVGDKDADKLLIVEYNGKTFYYVNNDEEHGLVQTGAEKITITYSVTAKNGDSIVGVGTTSWTFMIEDAEAEN